MKTSLLILVALTAIISPTFSQDIFINKDTLINNTWKIPSGAIIKFGSKGHISGTGTIRGGIIDASLEQWIFDTTLTIIPEGTYGKDFSAKWFGAGRVKDNSNALQKGINTVLANNETLRNFYIPKGTYNYGTPLIIANTYKGQYSGSTIHMYGETSFWDCCSGTTLRYMSTGGFALGLQLNKGTEINNLAITGQFKSPAGTDTAYYNTPFEKYKDANGKCGDYYFGIVIDFDGSKNVGGSTGVKIHDVAVSNFTIDYMVSPNGKTFNADILIFENIKCGDAKVGFASGQAQEKGNIIRGIYSWGSLHTLISIGHYGKSQAGYYTIDGGNIAGRCIRLFDISQSGWYATSISNLYSESIASIGNVYSQIPTAINNCNFHFVYAKVIGKQTILNSNNDKIKFSNCIFRYYGSKEDMKFAGYATYDNCFFSGTVVK
ncbi:hypothetical protein QWZ08_14825 [Ferruginibacter paludis]|uniref:hypothetical protein n=1 Tax=Ferruginibacter paludis TaxID=1310417 RepID=UPI0025B3D7CB|nr:hypothetical protein [Ferruginibacter paludis]MDN3656919.1 hypothetical protein [Ferruginibacter paludis]